MRKIYFRGKNLENGRWEYGYFVSTDYGHSNYIIDDLEGEINFIDTDTLGECIGTNSKGEKVFEGDIIGCSPLGGFFINGKKYKYATVIIGNWVDEDFTAKLVGTGDEIPCVGYGPALLFSGGETIALSESFISSAIIIGNIYDNKKMLNEKGSVGNWFSGPSLNSFN